MIPKEKLIKEATDVLRKLVPFITDDTVLLQAVESLMTRTFNICPYFYCENAKNPNYLAARVMTWTYYYTNHNTFLHSNAISLENWVKQAKAFLGRRKAL